MSLKNTLAGVANTVLDFIAKDALEPRIDAFVKQLVGGNDASHRLSDNAYNQFKVNLQKSDATEMLIKGGNSWAGFASMMYNAMDDVSEHTYYDNDKGRSIVVCNLLEPILRADADMTCPAVPVYIGAPGDKQKVTPDSLIGYILHAESPKELGERLGFLAGAPLPRPIFAGNRVR